MLFAHKSHTNIETRNMSENNTKHRTKTPSTTFDAKLPVDGRTWRTHGSTIVWDYSNRFPALLLCFFYMFCCGFVVRWSTLFMAIMIMIISTIVYHHYCVCVCVWRHIVQLIYTQHNTYEHDWTHDTKQTNKQLYIDD